MRAKVVLLLSTMHHDDKIGDSGKPEIVEFYNKTKAGGDAPLHNISQNIKMAACCVL